MSHRSTLAAPQPSPSVPVSIDDPINTRILMVSEDRVKGFHDQPFHEISRQSGVELPVVLERIRAMLAAGTIRRVRQTLMSTALAPGALVAWEVPESKLTAAFDWLAKNDPFSGHVVIRTTDTAAAGATYRLWTTLKVPAPYSMHKHCRHLLEQIGATQVRLMPAKRLFALGVGHVRRRSLEIGAKGDVPAEAIDTSVREVKEHDWQVLIPLKRELAMHEICENPWKARADEAGLSLEAFCAKAHELDERGVIGRFSTFLEHVKPLSDGERVTRFNGLFHWAVPPGREIEAGGEVGRFLIMTHAYWREGGPEFHHVNIMGVAHGTDKALVLAHKAAIDQHLAAVGIPVLYTNVFWGGRSEIKPSEISPDEYAQWCRQRGLDAEAMRA